MLHRVPTRPNNSTPRHTPKGKERRDSDKCHSSTIHSSRRWRRPKRPSADEGTLRGPAAPQSRVPPNQGRGPGTRGGGMGDPENTTRGRSRTQQATRSVRLCVRQTGTSTAAGSRVRLRGRGCRRGRVRATFTPGAVGAVGSQRRWRREEERVPRRRCWGGRGSGDGEGQVWQMAGRPYRRTARRVVTGAEAPPGTGALRSPPRARCPVALRLAVLGRP